VLAAPLAGALVAEPASRSAGKLNPAYKQESPRPWAGGFLFASTASSHRFQNVAGSVLQLDLHLGCPNAASFDKRMNFDMAIWLWLYLADENHGSRQV